MKKSLLLGLIIIALNSFAQEVQPDYNKFIKETQKTISKNGSVQVIWWIPTEFWDLALKNNQDVTEEQIQSLISVLEPYVIFAVVKGDIGEFGDINFLPLDQFDNQVSAIGINGKKYEPIPFEDLSVSVQTILSTMKPILKGAIGKMGENMHFFVFEDMKKKKRFFDPTAEGEVKLNVLDDVFTWNTPLSTLLAPKTCPIDAVEWNGAWNYCPIHGNELVDTEE